MARRPSAATSTHSSPRSHGNPRGGDETITAPANLGGDWGEDLAEHPEEAA